jgi:hypothetical protein
VSGSEEAFVSSAAPEYQVRKYVYDYFLRSGTAPTVARAAVDVKRSEASVREAMAALVATGAITLDRDTGEIWRAAPFCAVPTGFPVECDGTRVWGTCAWDALGIPAMLNKQASIAASCGCCNQPMTLSAGPDGLSGDEGVIHIAVPARDWYEDLVFT